MSKKEQEAMNAYVSEVEGAQATEMYADAAPETQMTTAEAARAARLHGRMDLPTSEQTGLQYKDNLGYLKIDVKSLPTQGLFLGRYFYVRERDENTRKLLLETC